MAEKFVPFDDAVSELGLSGDDLKEMMEQGKIRHFMDGGKVKFRRKDLDDLKASLGIAAAEEEISLAPPEAASEMPSLDTDEEEIPPPPAAEPEEFSIEPLDEDTKKPSFAATSAGKAEAVARPSAQAEEEVASLSDFAISSDVEEQGQELSGEEAELLAIQSPVRAFEEPGAANIGMSVLLIVAAVIIGFGAAILMCFPAGINPFNFLTDMFAGK